MLQPHLLQVHLQLFGDEHRDGGVRALAHLDVGHGQRHLAVRIDADECVGRKRLTRDFFGSTGGADGTTGGEPDQQAAAQRRARAQELTSGKIYALASDEVDDSVGSHVTPPSCRSSRHAPRA